MKITKYFDKRLLEKRGAFSRAGVRITKYFDKRALEKRGAFSLVCSFIRGCIVLCIIVIKKGKYLTIAT